MSDMKCLICGTMLDKAFINDKIRGCPKCRNMGNIELWQKLIRTRKALDKAKKSLRELKDIIACPPDISYETCVSMYADGVLQEITALEQKDAK